MSDMYFLNRATGIFFIMRVWIFLEVCINFRGNSYTIFRINAHLNNAIVRYSLFFIFQWLFAVALSNLSPYKVETKPLIQLESSAL